MPRPKKKTTGAASFCVPRAAIEALIDHQASAYEICTYLTLACFTDPTGCYSTASVHAANTYTGANKARLAKAIARLKAITVKRAMPSPPDFTEAGKVRHKATKRALPPPPEDLGPILYDRAGWEEATGEVLPVGATPQTTVQYVLPHFDEPLADRVWFGSNLVRGVGEFDRPLKALKNAGDEAARLLLLLYAAHDMDLWGGVDPHRGPWVHYTPADPPNASNQRPPYSEPIYGGQILRWTRAGNVSGGDFCRAWRAPGSDWWTAHEKAGGPVWRALEALEAVGFIYEMVLVVNRRGEVKTFVSGAEHYAVPANAEPLYELAARTRHGWRPVGEEGLADATADTAAHFSRPVARDTYAAFVPTGHGAMIAGVYRLRFRPSNPKNAGVRNAWARIHQGNRDGFELIQAIRAAHKLPELPPRAQDLPKEAPKRAARTRKTAGNRPKIARSRERTLQ